MKLNYIATEIERMSSIMKMSSCERVIAETAILLHDQIVSRYGMKGGCYLNALFLRNFLREKFQIEVKMVVGWVMVPSHLMAYSHAWITYNEKITDITLWSACSNTEDDSGSYLISGEEYKRGRHKYKYYEDLPIYVEDRLNLLKAENEGIRKEINSNFRLNKRFNLIKNNIGKEVEYYEKLPYMFRYNVWAKMLEKFITT